MISSSALRTIAWGFVDGREIGCGREEGEDDS
jgi:hypothetical protein